MKEVTLNFARSENRLAGFPYGEATYNEQVKENIDEYIKGSGKIKIIFPPQIEKVASSFVQGFFKELINTIGYDMIEEKIIIETSSDELTKKIIVNMY